MENISGKNLSVAFYWHMHQPVYELDGVFLMPWVRLHAVKDYLDMVQILDKYPKLKLNINIVPALLDALIQYTEEGFTDIHSTLTISDVEKLTESDKEYIINNFFNSKYETMVYQYPTYRKLFKKRFSTNSITTDDFTTQEYSDLMALFNLSWIDPTHYEKYPDVERLAKKGHNYTLKDRIKIIEIHKEIAKEIIPTYKKYIKEGRIELTTSPYYHPIMPILCDYETSAKNLHTHENLPMNLNLEEDAHYQVKSALDRIEEVFGVRPKGMWASEYCLTDKVLNLFAQEGVKWTISDETILSKSINFEFIRDFKGNIEDPYYLLKTYKHSSSNNENIDIIFRDSHIPNLINFEYCNIDTYTASNDLYNKIKSIQNKLLVSPDNTHLLTIALDGENCWENYPNDGNDFLNSLYSKITQDNSIETVLISEFISRERAKKTLNKIKSGSWINQSFGYWIGDPVKNLAWQLLNNVRNDIQKIIKDRPYDDNIPKSLRELRIAEGSDWFWWYGEPNNSGQDNVFDFLFREHLKNAYKFLGENYPEYLDVSIIDTAYENSGVSILDLPNDSNWLFSDSIDLVDGPVFQESKIFDNINYGFDNDNLYFKLELNPNFKEQDEKKPKVPQFYIYTKNNTTKQTCSSIRVSNRTEIVFPLLKTKYHNELLITLINNNIYPSFLSKAMADNLWTLIDAPQFNIDYNDKIDICIPFENLDVAPGEELEFFFVIANLGLRYTFMPKDTPLIVKRPYN